MKAKISKRSAALAAFLMIASILALPMTVSAGPVIAMSVANENPQTVSPGSSVTYNISLQNTGDASATVNLSTSGTPSSWSAQLSSSQVSVSVGNTVTVYLTVGAPANATADSVGKAIVVVGKYDSGGSEQTKQVTTTTKVSQVFNFGMAIEGSFNKDIAPGSSGTFTLNVSQTSQGNGVNYINLTPNGQQPDGLTISYSANPATLQAFSYSTVTVTVFVPQDASAKQYSYTLSGNSQGGGSAQTATIIVNVTQIWGLSLTAVDAVKYLNPDSQTTFMINVNNTGNKADTFDLTSVSFTTAAPGWTETHTSSVGPLSPKTSGQATIQVYAPGNASYPTNIQLKANFVSESNSTFIRNTTVTAVINKVNSTYVSANPFINNSDPGGTCSFKIQVKNTGNGQSSIDLTLPQFPSYLTPSLDSSAIDLAAGASANVNLTVSVGKDAPVGDSNIIVKGTVHDTAASSNFTIIVRVNQVYNLTVNPSGSYSQHISPGFNAVYGVTIKNTGNGNDTIAMSNGTAPTGLTTYFDTYSVTLGPGESKTINATVEVAKGTAAASHNIDLKGTSSGGKTASTTIIVIVDQHYEVSVTTPAAYNNTRPGNAAKYTVQVRNLGSGKDTFSITAGGDNPSWVSFSNSSLQLNSGEAYNLTVTVNVPSDAKKGNVTTIVKATSDSNSTANASVSLVTVIDQTYGVNAWASPSTAQVMPGQNGKYSIIIKNTGNSKDTYFVNLSKNPNNWASLDLASPFVVLDSDGFFTANLTVAVPVDAAVADVTTTVLVTSQGNTTVFYSVDAVTSVTAIYNMELIVNNINASVEPTDTVTYEVRVKNTGNSLDTFNLDITGEKRAWATLNVTSLTLASGTSSPVTVSVTVPDNEQLANWTISFKATSLGNTSKTASVNLNIQVKSKHDLDLSSGDFIVKKKGDPGSSIVFKINVTNKGPDSDTVDLTLSGNHTSWASLSQDSVVLAYGASYTLNLTVTIPSNAVPESFLLTVTGKLKSNANRTKALELTVTVGQIYKLEISSLLSENSTSPGGTVTYSVKVKNTGTGNDTIQLSAQNYTTWISFSKSSLTLGPDSSDNITVTITVPSKPLPTKGDYNIGILAKSIGNESVTANMTLVMTISQVYGVEVSSNVSVSYVDPGTSASYSISVKNTGNGQDSFSMTKSGDHTDWVTFSSSSITLDGGSTSSVTLIVQVPSNAYPQNLTVKVNCKSQGNSTVQQNLTLVTTINLLYGLDLTASDTSKELTGPYNATYNLTVRNTGNSNDTMEFEAVGARMDWVTFNVSSVLLGPGNSSTVMVTIHPPWSTPYDKLTGTYTNLIKVTSRGYSFATSNVSLSTKINIVYDLTANWDVISKTSGPGGTVTFNVTIKNTGNIADIYVINSQTFTTWASFSNNNVTILSQSQDTIMMTVNVPSGQANGDYVLTVEVKSIGNDTKKKTQDIKVSISEVFGVSLTSEDVDKEGGQGSSVVYTIKVKNTGNVLERINLKISEGNYKDWAILSVDSAQLGEKGEQEITVTLQIPVDQGPGTYPVTLKAEVKDHTETTGVLTLTTTVSYGVELTTKEPKKKGQANDLVTFTVTVKNKGTGNDTFDLSVLDPYSSWLVGFDFNNFELMKDKTKQVKVTFQIPKDAKMQDNPISLKVVSNGDSGRSMQLTLTISVERTPALKLECNDIDQTARPGMTVIYTFRVINDGNGPDSYKLKIQDGDYSNWASVSRESTSSIGVDAFEELTVTVTLPNDAASGFYNHTLKVWSADNESVTATLIFKTKIEAVYNFLISADEATLDGEPGDAVSYILKLENTGNNMDSYDITVKDLPSMWSWSVGFETLSVDSKAKSTFTFWINISGDYAKAKADSYSFSVRFTSRGNDTIEKTLTLTTVVKQVYGIELTAESGVNEKEIDPYGDDEDFTVNVKNTGNGEDTVTFRIKTYPPGWSASYFTITPSGLTVSPGNTSVKQTTVRLSATSIIDVNVGKYDFTVIALSKNGDEFSPLKLTINVIKGEVADLNQADITLSQTNVDKGDTVSVTVTVRNVGSSEMKNVVVQIYANSNSVASKTITSPIKKNSDAQVTLEWTTDTEDTYSLKVTARYQQETAKELKLTQKVSVGQKGAAIDLMSWLPWILVGVLVVIVVAVAVAMGRRRKPAPPQLPPARPPARPVPAPAKPPAEEEEEEEEEEMLAPKPPTTSVAPAQPEAKPKIARIKCPKCGETKDVTSPVRPIEVKCDKCGARLRLVK